MFGREGRVLAEVAAPGTRLLATGWRRIGLIDPAEVPGTRRTGNGSRCRLVAVASTGLFAFGPAGERPLITDLLGEDRWT